MGKEPACNAGDAGDAGSIPGSRRSGGGLGNPLHYSGRLQSTGLQRVGHKVIEHTRTHAIQLGKKNPEKNKELIYATMWMNIMLSGKKHLENMLS